MPPIRPVDGGRDAGAQADAGGDAGRRDAGGDAGGARDAGELADAGVDGRACPSLMVLVDDRFCVDQYEGALEERIDGGWRAASPYQQIGTRVVRAVPAQTLVPQGYISGAEAAAACATSGKRLCSSDEWLIACGGTNRSTWPYGNTYQSGACNDTYPAGHHPVVDFFGTSTGVFDSAHMNNPGINQQPGTVARGGAFGRCVSTWGAYDMHGNLHEWVADADGTFRGGFYADGAANGQGCTYRTTAHAFSYHDYSTGFRCCSEKRR